MKKKTLRKIISGEKTTFRVSGYTYRIQLNPGTRRVVLIPVGDGDIARSCLRRDQYEFTHGGRTFRHAVEIAQEIAEALPQDTNS